MAKSQETGLRSRISRAASGKDWRERFRELGIRTVADAASVVYAEQEGFGDDGIVVDEGVVVVTNCSAAKTSIANGTPRELYTGKAQQRLFRVAEQGGWRHGIISDLYGLVGSAEKVDNYDVGPNNLTEADLMDVGMMIRRQCEEHGIETLVFVASSPIMATPYLVMLLASGTRFVYTTSLGRIVHAEGNPHAKVS